MHTAVFVATPRFSGVNARAIATARVDVDRLHTLSVVQGDGHVPPFAVRRGIAEAEALLDVREAGHAVLAPAVGP